MKHKLVFDALDAETILASDSVGARVRSGVSGALITNTASQRALSVTFTFVDGDVTVGTDAIAETAHGLQTGDKVQLSNAGGALPTGLAAATDYYVIRVDADSFKLAANPEDAELGQAVDITAAAGGGTHTLTGQESEVRALDVAISNTSFVVTATDLDIRDLAFATDSVDVSGSEVSLDAATLAALETITVEQGTSPWVIGDGGGSITVDAVDLDIRDLSSASDSVAAWLSDGTGNAITSSAGALDVNIASSDISINVDLQNGAEFAEDAAHTSGDIGNHVLAVRQDTLAASTSADGDYASLKVDDVGSLYVKDTDVLAQLVSGVTVSATNLDIRDLSASQDNVAISDGTDTLAINADGSINVVSASDDSALADTAVLASSKTSTTSSASLALSLANRKYLSLYNNGNKTVFIGQSGVTTADGFPLFPGSLIDLRIGASVALHSVAQGGSQNLRALELS